MLVSLHVKNLALIEETEVYFGSGLNILTGETGAGKSILIGSVGLALGERAGQDRIRTGADHAWIELVFSLPRGQQQARVRELGIEIEEDGMLVLTRRIMPGRSVCRVNGETVNSRLVRELSGILIDIHGQRDTQELLKTKRHLEILDDYAAEEMAELKSGIRSAYRTVRELSRELARTDMDGRERERALSLARYEEEEITAAALVPGEDERLEASFRRLSNKRRLAEVLGNVYALTGYESDQGAAAATGRALRELNAAAAYDDLEEMERLLTDADSLLNDFNRTLSDYLMELETGGEDYSGIEERLNVINRLKDKYGNTIDDILRYRQERQAEIERLENLETSRAQLKARLAGEQDRLSGLCEQASAVRSRAALSFSDRMRQALSDLNFERVDFAVQINRLSSPGPDGWDDVTFFISTNPGEPRKPLASVASGGELSRIMLALKTVTSGTEDKDTFIFDEIDAGISGKTAWRVAGKLGDLSRTRQVICITHLPQIASMADHHFVIEKTSASDSTVTDIRELEEEEILEELSRMIGGDTVTQSTLANARELREMATSHKKMPFPAPAIDV